MFHKREVSRFGGWWVALLEVLSGIDGGMSDIKRWVQVLGTGIFIPRGAYKAACSIVVLVVKSTLVPKGTPELIVKFSGGVGAPEGLHIVESQCGREPYTQRVW